MGAFDKKAHSIVKICLLMILGIGNGSNSRDIPAQIPVCDTTSSKNHLCFACNKQSP